MDSKCKQYTTAYEVQLIFIAPILEIKKWPFKDFWHLTTTPDTNEHLTWSEFYKPNFVEAVYLIPKTLLQSLYCITHSLPPYS